jgi:hypothetical protein
VRGDLFETRSVQPLPFHFTIDLSPIQSIHRGSIGVALSKCMSLGSRHQKEKICRSCQIPYQSAMRILRFALFVTCLPLVVMAEPGPLQFDGFTMNGEGFQQKDLGNFMGQNIKAFLYLAPSEGFAPNVNVIIQDFTGSVADYVAITKKEFVAVGFKDLNGHTSENEWNVEYTGKDPSSAKELHFYARAIFTGAKVYLATATATPTQWDQYSPKLIECVNSLALTKGQPDQGQQSAGPLHD